MQTNSQPHPAPPCTCQQQLGDALPWLAVALVILAIVDRFGRRRKKKVENGGKA